MAHGPLVIVPRGGGVKKKKVTQVSKYFFWRLGKIFRDYFFIAFFNSPCYETPKKRDKQNR
jgi:hypothetical protein